jgi:putative hemolysin
MVFLHNFLVQKDGKMARKLIFLLFLSLFVLAAASCSSQKASPTPEAGLPNPASVYCEEHGGKLEIRTAADGGQTGICVFSDGSECDEWPFFRGECKPGDSLQAPAPAGQPNKSDWKTYRDEDLGFSFDYPADANIVSNDDPLNGLSVTGPLVGEDHWPMFYVNYPRDREEFRPPEGADLAQWLTDHNLLAAGDKLPDAQIAGTIAIHTRHEPGPQSYGSDGYYFVQSGQLYQIVILHTGDREDWGLYNRFLESIRFD